MSSKEILDNSNESELPDSESATCSSHGSTPLDCFMANVVGEVGIFGTLAVLHDYFDRNLSCYETYPVIQRELRRFDRELRVAVEAVDPVIDREVAEEAAAERRYQHQITELIDRAVDA